MVADVLWYCVLVGAVVVDEELTIYMDRRKQLYSGHTASNSASAKHPLWARLQP